MPGCRVSFLYFLLQEFIQAEQLKFLASGREDVDVRMLGKTQSLASGFLQSDSDPCIPDKLSEDFLMFVSFGPEFHQITMK